MESACLVLTSLPETIDAGNFAMELVKRRLCACAHLLPAGRSFYIWEDKLEESTEQTLMLKTDFSAVANLIAELSALHPYEVPEILVFHADSGAPAYLQWVAGQCRLAPDGSSLA